MCGASSTRLYHLYTLRMRILCIEQRVEQSMYYRAFQLKSSYIRQQLQVDTYHKRGAQCALHIHKQNCLFGCCALFVNFGMCWCIKKVAIWKYACCMRVFLLAGQSVRVQRSNNRQRRFLFPISIDFITRHIFIVRQCIPMCVCLYS